MKRCPICQATYRKAPLRCPLDQTPLVDQIDERLGQQIGAWTLLELIMEGNLATVYKVEREGVIGALKIYSPAAPMQRAWREGEHQSRVVHPNVAVLLDQGVTGAGEIFLVTEYVAGQTIRELLQPPGRETAIIPPWEDSLRIAVGVARGLEAIHQADMIHRDIKPANVMLVAAPPEGIVVLDLGHSLVIDVSRLTESGMVWGSAPYMSPEQAAGLDLDWRSDIYSLGVLLYELLTGRPPFEAKSAAEVMQMHWSMAAVPPARCEASLPRAISDLCMWLLAKQPEHRPTTARVAGLALGGLLHQNAAVAKTTELEHPMGGHHEHC